MSDGARSYFDALVASATSRLVGREVLLANVSGESTDFIRLNDNAVRQAGSIEQARLGIDLVDGRRHVEGSLQLTGDRSVDEARVGALIDTLREQNRLVADDPFLLYNTEPTSSERIEQGSIPEPHDALDAIRSAGDGKDLVGIYAAGEAYHGFANSLGQRNWFQSSSFNLDWCFYLHADKAAKNLYAGFEWDDESFRRKVDWSSQQLGALAREPITLAPGEYRTYLAPAALEQIVQLMSSYGAFGRRAHETKQTPLLRMIADGASLSPLVSISEHTAAGAAPNFQSAGFVRPDQVELVVDGGYADTLVSPRSSKEYGVATNGASDSETPESFAMAPGTLPVDGVGQALDTGLFVGNLWYTNFSDRMACRTTGMTRFATFWMEGGEIVAPVNVMRYDDTSYHLLGEHLEALTDQAEVLLDAGTYFERSTASHQLPGALVSAMRFVL